MVLLPGSLEELWELWHRYPAARLFAGGTDFLVRRRAGLVKAETLIGLERVVELGRIEENDAEIAVGAAVSHSRLLAAPVIGREFPLLAQALASLGSPHIRNMGTIGGNIMTASPAGDCLPPLYVLGAELELRCGDGCRRLPLVDFISGPGQTAGVEGEVLSRVLLPRRPFWRGQYFEKVGRRRALAIAVVSLAAVFNLDSDGRVDEIRLAWGSSGPTIVTLPAVEEFLLGKTLNHENLQAAGALVEGLIKPISDIRAGAAYRRRLAGNLLQRLGSLAMENEK